jgi:putative transposase
MLLNIEFINLRLALQPVSRGNSAVGANAVRGLEPRALEREVIPLNAWARLLLEQLGDPRISGGSGAQALQRVQVVRTDTLRLLTTPELDDFLQRVGDATAKLINMENYRRRHLFFETGKIDYSWMSAWMRRKAEYYSIYKLLGSMNFHEACRLIGEQWKSFLGLLRAAKEGRLEPWQKVRSPGYRKDKDGQRIPIVVVRFDNYRIDMERRVLHLGLLERGYPVHGEAAMAYEAWGEAGAADHHLRTCKEAVVRSGERGGDAGAEAQPRLEGWHRPWQGALDRARHGAVERKRRGRGLLYRGGPLKSDYFYFEKKIAKIDKMLSDPKLEEMDRAVLKEDAQEAVREEEEAEGPIVR